VIRRVVVSLTNYCSLLVSRVDGGMHPPQSIHPNPNPSVLTSTGGSPSGSMDSSQLISFLREYRALECHCCSAVFGFQHKATGIMYCVDGCHERSPASPAMQQSPNMMVPVPAYSPPNVSLKINQHVPEIPNKNHMTMTQMNGAAVSNGIVDVKKNIVNPPTAVASSVAVTANPLASVPRLVPTQALAQTQVKVKPTETLVPVKAPLVVTSPSQNSPVVEEVRKAVDIPTPTQPQHVKSNVNVPAAVPSTSSTPRQSADVTDSKLAEPKSAGLKSVRVKPNSDVELSRANIPWPDVGTAAEAVVCTLAFDCGDGSFFVQPCTPQYVKFTSSVANKIVEVIRSGKCKQLVKPEVGRLCLAPFEGAHYRAEIISAEDDGKWRVFFIDYGNTEKMANLDLLGIPDELKQEPRLCLFGYWDQVLAGTKKPEELFETGFDADTESMSIRFRKKIADGQYIFQIGEPAKATFSVDKSSTTPPQPKTPAVPQWRDCSYSANLKSNEPVHVVHGWNATTFQVIADADEVAITNFQTLIKDYASTAKRLSRPPVLDEIVIAKYEGEYYRGKVDKVDGNNCTCSFLDYGDSKVSIISDVMPVNDAIMKYPVYGLTIRLDKVPAEPENFVLDASLEELIYNNTFILDLIQKTSIKPADLPFYDARLWDVKKENTLNDAVKSAIVAFKSKN